MSEIIRNAQGECVMTVTVDQPTTMDNIINLLETDDEYAEYLAQKMILTLLKKTDPKSKLAYKICASAEGNFQQYMVDIGVKFPAKPKPKGQNYVYGSTPKAGGVNPKDWETLVKFYETQVAYKEEENNLSPDAFLRNLRRMGDLVGFNELQIGALEYVYALSNVDPAYTKFFQDVLRGQSSKFPALIAMVMGKPQEYKEIAKNFGVSGTFSSYGIIEYEDMDRDEEGVPIIDEGLRYSMSDGDIEADNLIDMVVGKPATTTLTIEENFAHLADEAERITNIIIKAIEQKKKGINIALYGPAGSGKTELAKAIAKKLNLRLFAIGESEGDNMQYSVDDKKSSSKRLSSLLRAQAILKDQGNAVVLMDEFEDLLLKGTDTEKTADPESKILLNRTLEENQVVTIWACNDIGKFHASMRQRFFASAFVGYQPTLIRKDIWQYHMTANKLNFTDAQILGLARQYDAPPRVISQVCAAASLLGGKIDVIHDQMEDKAKLLYGNRYAMENGALVPESYDTAYISCDKNIDELTASMIDASKQNMPYSLLIAGGKGTGKSTYGFYLAEKMIRSPMVADMKELIEPSQQAAPEDKLCSVFNMAADTRSLLMIDNLQALFRNADKMDKQNMIEAFWMCMKTHRAPVIFTVDALENAEEMRDCFNAQTTFRELSGDKYDTVYKAFFKKLPEDGAKPRAIGDLAKAASLVSRVPHVANDTGEIEKRIAASATMGASRSIGFGPK